MNAALIQRIPSILLVDDCKLDAHLTEEALQESPIKTHLYVVQDGQAAMRFLRRQELFREVPRPDLILLDLNLPRMDGRETLVEIKGDPSLRRIPVVVLTSSISPEDVTDIYDLQANSFINKPIDLHDFIDKIKVMTEYWLHVASLPREGETSPA